MRQRLQPGIFGRNQSALFGWRFLAEIGIRTGAGVAGPYSGDKSRPAPVALPAKSRTPRAGNTLFCSVGRMKMRVLTILLRHGTEKYGDAEHRIDDIFARQMPEVERHTLIVDNLLPPHVAERTGERKTVIGGDNGFWEFSGWDRGIAFAGSNIFSYDLVHLVTSAFFTLYVKYLDRINTRMLETVAGRPVCLGHIDCFNEPVRFLSFYSQHWLRSCFLFLPPAELKALGSLVSFRDAGMLFTGDPAEPFREDAPISKNYQNYILGWLTGSDIGQGVEWHSSFVLDRATLPYFQEKTLAMINEHMLSVRLRALGCRTTDVTWLATKMAQAAAEIPWSTGWRTQLAERDSDALVLPSKAAVCN